MSSQEVTLDAEEQISVVRKFVIDKLKDFKGRLELQQHMLDRLQKESSEQKKEVEKLRKEKMEQDKMLQMWETKYQDITAELHNCTRQLNMATSLRSSSPHPTSPTTQFSTPSTSPASGHPPPSQAPPGKKPRLQITLEDLKPTLAAKIKPFIPNSLDARDKLSGLQSGFFHYMVEEMTIKGKFKTKFSQ